MRRVDGFLVAAPGENLISYRSRAWQGRKYLGGLRAEFTCRMRWRRRAERKAHLFSEW